ncbi:unnamed protein product [Adineta ricciae]|uniref:SZT2-like protein n=1 Tax=Adineta ricciae TaxID=249248 RepID=A0A813NDM5_ADIRI|nr:unnamed protein product [Adineta ricciae]
MQTPIHANQVFALLCRNYRVSRNTRALWQFQQIAASSLNQVRIPTTEEIKQSSDEIVLLSAVDHNNVPIPASSTILCTSSTRFSYFTTRYKFAFILDMTDSCASVSIDGGHVYLESLTNCLCVLLYSLAQTFTLPGCELKFQPEIDISVYVYFPLHRTPNHQVLIHGYRLNWSTLENVCRDITNNLKSATDILQKAMSNGPPLNTHSISSTMDSDDNINAHLNSVYLNSESSCAIINMLSYGITALQLTPEESTAALVIITDGILDVPNITAFETVMRQIRARIISCSFVQIGSNNQRQQTINSKVLKPPTSSLGHVPNEELLKFISLSTFGSFIHFDVDHISNGSTLLLRLFSKKIEISYACKRLHEFQNELLSWGFHKAISESSISSSKRVSSGSFSVDDENSRNLKLHAISLPISCKLVNQSVLQTSLENVLSLRLREGYTVRHVQIKKDEIEVHLILPWRYDIQIYYTARSVWPLTKSIRTDIRVYKEAPVYFLQESNQLTYSQTSKAINMTRNNLVRRYNDVIQTVSITDRHLTLINTFAQNSSYYKVPETIKRGKPMFFVTVNNSQQTVLNVKDESLQEFFDFWRPIVILDGSLWQRFMYTHNLTIILVNDPLSNSLFNMHHHLSQSHTQQYSSVSCRIAKTDFEAFLAEYFSFVLLDGQSYIKFLTHENNDNAPYSFMLLRIMGQPPLLYLKFAFQSNASTVERHNIMEDFRSNLVRLRPRSRTKLGNVNEGNRKQQTSTPVSSVTQRTSSSASIPVSTISQRTSSITSSALTLSRSTMTPTLTSCCVALNKNIERLILKPDPFPYDLLGIPKHDDDDMQQKNRLELDSKRQALSKFFYIRTFIRSFDSLKHLSNVPKRIPDIILDTFIRRRLQEGFHFATSHNNIHNLVLEVKMNTPKDECTEETFHLNPAVNFYPDERVQTCLVQYRIYPVEYGRASDVSPTREIRAMSLRRSSSIYCDQPTSYYFLTQCWVEPQDGVVEADCPELEFLNRCTYKEIVDKIHVSIYLVGKLLFFSSHINGFSINEVDRECFNTLVSFYFVKYLQERNAISTGSTSRPLKILSSDTVSTSSNHETILIPYNQDTISLIRRSHQTHFAFSAFIDDYDKIERDYTCKNSSLPTKSLNSTLLSVLYDRLCSKNYENKRHLFADTMENHNAFTSTLLHRSTNSKLQRLPIGLRSLKSSPYLLYLLNYNQQQNANKPLTNLEQYLIEMLFPRWNFLVSTDGDEHVYMILLPKTERDLLLLNIDLNALMHDLIGQYTMENTDNGLPVYDDSRYMVKVIIDEIEASVGHESTCVSPTTEQSDQKVHKDQMAKYAGRRRQRRDTFTSADLLTPHTLHAPFAHSRNSTSSPIPIVHSVAQHLPHSSSHPNTIGCRRMYSPLTVDTNNVLHVEASPRRYSASAALSPPNHHYSIHPPPIVNVIHAFPQQDFSQESNKRSSDQQWHIPIFLYGCNKGRLAASLLLSNEQQWATLETDAYHDCTIDDSDSTNDAKTVITTTTSQNTKLRKRDNSRRYDEDNPFPDDKQVENMRESLDYAFATAFYKNCLLDLTTHRNDIDHALNAIYFDHCEDIDLTSFLKAMCSHLSDDELQSEESGVICTPTSRNIHTYLHEKFLHIINKFFRRVSSDSDYFYFRSNKDSDGPSRNSVEIDRLTDNNDVLPTSGPYKFDDTNGMDHESSSDTNNDDDDESNRTVYIHENNDDEEYELQLANTRRRSDESSSSISNRSRDLSAREIFPLFICFDCRLVMKDYDYNKQVKTIPLCINEMIVKPSETTIDHTSLRVSFGLMCLTFGREDVDTPSANINGMATNTPTFNHPLLSGRRYQELNSIDAVENASTCTGTTMGGELNKNPLDKLRLSDAQRRAIILCRREIEWLLRDEQLSTYFTRRSLDRNLIEQVIGHVQASSNIQASKCLCRSIDLKFVLGIDKSLKPFLEELRTVRIQDKYVLTECGNYYVLLEPMYQDSEEAQRRRISALSTNSSDDQSSLAMEDSLPSDCSIADDDEMEKPSTDDKLDDYVKPSFWLFIERKKKTSGQVDLLEVKFYLYCGSSSDTMQHSEESKKILDELINEFKQLCRTTNQKLLMSNLSATRLCNSLLVPPGENDDLSLEADAPILAANLNTPQGEYACDELWTHSFPLHFRLRPHLHVQSTSKSPSGYHSGSLLRELSTHFSALAVHNRKNLFVYCGERNYYYMRFREDTLPPSGPSLVDENATANDGHHPNSGDLLSPQIYNGNNTLSLNSSMRNRQRHDSGTYCIHVMLYGLKSSIDPKFETIKSNLIQSIVSRLEDEVVKELVNALYHFAMPRLNPDDVTFIRPIDSEPKHVFEYKISPLINTNAFLYYFRRYVKTNQFHQPLFLPVLAKDLKDIIKDYRGQTLIVYNKTFNIRIPRPGLAWIELHVLNSANRPSPLSTEDLTDELTVDSLIDLIRVTEISSATTSEDNTNENVLRCNVWARGGQPEIEPVTMSNTLLQAFTYALADYVTEYKLLPKLYNSSGHVYHRHGSLEPPPSPRSVNTVKFANETTFILDRNVPTARTFTADAGPTTPTVQSRRRQESIQSSILSHSSMDEPQALSVQHAQCLTSWFQHLTTEHPKLPSLTSSSHTLSNRMLLVDVIHNFTSWLNDQKFIAYKHESLHGMIFRCNQERTLYLPVPSLDQMPTRVPGENLDLIVLYQSTKTVNDLVIESNESSPQQESVDAMALANSSDIPKQIFLCIIANDKKLTITLHNAPDELSKLLIKHFSEIISWANRRLHVLNIIVTQKMGLFRYRSFHSEQHSEYSRHHGQQGIMNKHSIKGEGYELEQVIKETLPPKAGNTSASWSIDLLYCNLIGAYPSLSNDSSQDLVQRHGTQLLRLRENKKTHMDRCTQLEEACSNWILTPKKNIADDLLTQMKRRSRLLNIAVVPLLFSRPARHFFQNDFTLRVDNVLCLNDYQIAQSQLIRHDSNPSNMSTEQQHTQIIDSFIEQMCSFLQVVYKFYLINTKPNLPKINQSTGVRSPVKLNFHRSDSNRRATLLVELSSLNKVQLVLRFLQYDIIKFPTNNQTSATTHLRSISNDTYWIPEQTELDAFVYDFHLQTIVRYQTNPQDANLFAPDFSIIAFLQDFIEYYPNAPVGSKTALFKTIIHHTIDVNKRAADTYLFKYVLEHATSYNIQVKRRNSDEYLFDCDRNDIYWMAARATPSSSSELTVVMYIIYTNLNPKQQNLPAVTSSALNKISIPPPSNTRIANSLKNNSNTNQMRERASTILLPSVKANLVTPVRPNAVSSDQAIASNIPVDRNVEYFKSKITLILNKASLSHRRESLWEKLIATRSDNPLSGRHENVPIHTNEFQTLLDSCVGDETMELPAVNTLLQRVFSNKEQLDRLYRFLRSRYSSQFHMLNSATVTYLVVFQCNPPQQRDAFLVLIYRSDQNNLKSCLVKRQNDVDCTSFIETFTHRISYFLWECLI